MALSNKSKADKVPFFSIFTSFSPLSPLFITFSLVALVSLFGLSIWMIQYDIIVSIFCFLHIFLGLIGLFYYHKILKNSTNIEKTTKISPSTCQYRLFYLLPLVILGIPAIQLKSVVHVYNLLPFEWGQFIYALLVAFSEELFFRGFLTLLFLKLGDSNPSKNQNQLKISLNYIFILLLVVPSLLWTAIHFNYYGNVSFLLQIFVTGILLEFYFLFRKNLSQIIIIHFFYNVIVNVTTYFGN